MRYPMLTARFYPLSRNGPRACFLVDFLPCCTSYLSRLCCQSSPDTRKRAGYLATHWIALRSCTCLPYLLHKGWLAGASGECHCSARQRQWPLLPGCPLDIPQPPPTCDYCSYSLPNSISGLPILRPDGTPGLPVTSEVVTLFTGLLAQVSAKRRQGETSAQNSPDRAPSFQFGSWIAITFSTACAKVGMPPDLSRGSLPFETALRLSSAFSRASAKEIAGKDPSSMLARMAMNY